jgi:hypothetical protein
MLGRMRREEPNGRIVGHQDGGEAADQQPLLKGSGIRVFPSASERENGSLMLRMERRIIGGLHP